MPPIISCLPVSRKQQWESEDQEVVLNVKPERNYIKQITHCRKPVIAILGSCNFGSAVWGNICVNFELRMMQSRAKVSGSHTTGSNNYGTSSRAWYSPSKKKKKHIFRGTERCDKGLIVPGRGSVMQGF